MSKRFIILKNTVEILLAMASFFLLLTSITVFCIFWKLSRGPVNVTWAQEYVQKILGGDSGVELKAGSIIAEWKSWDSPLALGISDLNIKQHGGDILNVSQAGVQIAKAPLFIGVVSPESIYIKAPSIQLKKGKDGKFSFLIANNNDVQDPESTMTPEEFGNSLFLGGFLEGGADLPFSRLRSFIIEDASLTISDQTQNNIVLLPHANVMAKRTHNKVSIALDYEGTDKREDHGDGRSQINAVLTRGKDINFFMELHKIDPSLWAVGMPSLPGLIKQNVSFNGNVVGVFGLDWHLEKLSGNVDATRDAAQKQSFKISALRGADGILPVEIMLPEVGLDQISSLWPENYKNINAAVWLTQRLSKGTIKNLSLQLPFKNENGRWVVSGDASGRMDFENLTTDYRAPLYPVTEADGNAVIDHDTLTINVTKGKLVDMDVKSGSVVVTKLINEGSSEVTVKVNLDGPLSTALKYISLEPINLGDKLKTDVNKVEGRADVNVTVNFPALIDLPIDQVNVDVDAKLNNVRLPAVVRGLDLAGGPFDLKVGDGMLNIGGNGTIDGVPLDFTYKEHLVLKDAPNAGEVTAKLVSDDGLRSKFSTDLADYMSGKIPLDVKYTDNLDGTAVIDVKGDLSQAKVFVKPLNFEKNEGIAGTMAATISLKGDAVQKISGLNVEMGKDSIAGGNLQFGLLGKENNVVSGSFEKVKLGEANDFSLKLKQSVSTLNVDIGGASVDARAFIEDKDREEVQRTRDADVTLKTVNMRMGDAKDQALKSAMMRVLVNPAGDVKNLDLSGLTGKGNFNLKLGPSASGQMALKMTSNDAGSALNMLGAYTNMVGGTLDVSAVQMPNGKINDMQGNIIISDFRVIKAPVLAKLIGAFSITGLPELLMNDGISFSKLKARFNWKKSGSERTISLFDGATSGGSVGLTFGGVINQTKDTVDISGTFVPISQINKIVSSIPIVGQLLTGGKNGGVIAATYSLKGPSEDPSVVVNPLSVLAPGFLRSILFEGALTTQSTDTDKILTRQKNNN